MKDISETDVFFKIENQIDFQPNISFIPGGKHSNSHIKFDANLSTSIYVIKPTIENLYININISISVNFKV